jgi:hypothetical protein
MEDPMSGKPHLKPGRGVSDLEGAPPSAAVGGHAGCWRWRGETGECLADAEMLAIRELVDDPRGLAQRARR